MKSLFIYITISIFLLTGCKNEPIEEKKINMWEIINTGSLIVESQDLITRLNSVNDYNKQSQISLQQKIKLVEEKYDKKYNKMLEEFVLVENLTPEEIKKRNKLEYQIFQERENEILILEKANIQNVVDKEQQINIADQRIYTEKLNEYIEIQTIEIQETISQ